MMREIINKFARNKFIEDIAVMEQDIWFEQTAELYSQ